MKNEIQEKLMGLANLGKEMRLAQKNYFSTRSNGWLNQSKRLEKLFDREIEDIINGQQKLEL